jgi:hypothetical protein
MCRARNVIGKAQPFAAHLDGEALGGVPAITTYGHPVVRPVVKAVDRRESWRFAGLQTCSDKVFRSSGWRDLNSRPLDPQTSAACPRTSPDVQFSLRIRILHLSVFRWTDPNGGQNGGQTHSQTKQRGLVRSRLCIAMAAVMPSTIAGVGRIRAAGRPDHCGQRYVTGLSGRR